MPGTPWNVPAASALGTVTIGAGAGANPFYTNGTAYLAGPYKGAPLSMAVITPAIAGPFDLGVVVVRAALYVDPASARIHAVSDPFPTILQGIPLDLRSVAVKLDRPSFTLNPTSCDPMAITANAVPVLGASSSARSLRTATSMPPACSPMKSSAASRRSIHRAWLIEKPSGIRLHRSRGRRLSNVARLPLHSGSRVRCPAGSASPGIRWRVRKKVSRESTGLDPLR